MILDLQNILEDQKDLTTITFGTPVVSTNAIDLWGQAAAPTIPQGGSVIKDVGRGRPPEVFVQVTQTCTSGGAPTMMIQLIGATATDLTTGQVIYQETAAIALATLVAGYQFRLAIPQGIALRYLGIRFVTLVANYTAGKVSAGLVDALQTMPFVG